MKKILLPLLAAIMGGFVAISPISASAPAYATSSEPCTCVTKNPDGSETVSQGTKVPTAILGDEACDCGHGEAIVAILSLVVRILMIGVGVLGAIGITIAGIQYLTAGGNEEQTRKSKRRIFEIVIGFAAFFLIVALLDFLLPGFEPIGF